MRIKSFKFIVFFLSMFFLVCFNEFDAAFSDVLDEYIPPKHVIYKSGVWTFEFDLDVDFTSDGKASANISGLQKKHSSSWSSLTLTAKVIRIKKLRDKVSASVEIQIKGNARGISAPVTTLDKPGTWTWKETSEEPFTDTIKEQVLLPFDRFPELADIESFEADNPTEISVDEPIPSKPDNEEQFEERTFVKSHRGMVRVKKADTGEWVKIQTNMKLEIGDTVKTSANGRADIVLAGTAIVKVKPGTEFVIPKDKANTEKKVGFIKMVKGFLFARAKKERNSLKIATPNAICGVRGTQFDISFQDNKTCVNVIEGTVWLAEKEGMQEVVITAGEQACIPKSEQKIPEISGDWKTSFGTMTFIQTDSNVTGSYSHDGGKIEETLEGKLLRGKWSEGPSYNPPKDAGEFEFIFSEDGESFKGTWRYGFNGEKWNGRWTGKKLK